MRWPEGRSVLRGRSACDACGRTLAARDLVPLASAIAARGRCRTCGTAIDSRHWQIEAAALLIGIAAGLAAPWPWAAAGAGFGWLLLALAALDIAAFWLPDRLTGTLALTGLGAGWLGVPPALPDRLIGGVAGFGALWLIARGYRVLRGREGLGGGDPKLLGAIGMWLGWALLAFVVLIASAAGLAALLVARRRIAADTRLPFGALLAVGAYPLWLLTIGWAT